MTLKDELDAISVKKIDLTDASDVHRPNIRISADTDKDERACVSLSIGALWAQPTRFVDLTPLEARRLARFLAETADAVDQIEQTGGAG